jgi:hypothetical protein
MAFLMGRGGLLRGEMEKEEAEESPFAKGAKDWQLAGWKPALRVAIRENHPA